MRTRRPHRFGGKGALNPMAILNAHQVLVIRFLHERYHWKNKKLREKLFPQVGQSQMYNILNYTNWTDVRP